MATDMASFTAVKRFMRLTVWTDGRAEAGAAEETEGEKGAVENMAARVERSRR
jgi:hypothetical protein